VRTISKIKIFGYNYRFFRRLVVGDYDFGVKNVKTISKIEIFVISPYFTKLAIGSYCFGEKYVRTV
jgi:hypothetical protein